MILIKNKPFIITTIAVFIAITVILLKPEVKFTKEEIKAKVKSGEVVKQDGVVYFAINGYEFEVLEGYMKSIGRKMTNRQIDSAQMHALLPNFQTYKKGVNDYEFFEERGHGSKLQISVKIGEYTKERMINFLKLKGFYEKYTKNRAEKVEEINDLESFPIRGVPVEQDYLFNRNVKNYPDTYLICATIGSAPSPSCWMRWSKKRGDESTEILTIFHRKYLPDWKDIRKKTELMIKNQLTEEK